MCILIKKLNSSKALNVYAKELRALRMYTKIQYAVNIQYELSISIAMFTALSLQHVLDRNSLFMNNELYNL